MGRFTILLKPSRKKHYEDCALRVAPIVAISACRFYMKFFWFSQWLLFCKQVKLVSALENKKWLIRFRVYDNVQQLNKRTETDNDGYTPVIFPLYFRYILLLH